MKQNQYLSHYIRLFLIQFLPNVRGLSENTILAYRDALKLLLNYCVDYLNIKIEKSIALFKIIPPLTKIK